MFAGGAIVFFTGLMISGAAFVVSALLAYALPARILERSTLIAGVPAIFIAVFMGYGIVTYRAEANAYLDQQITNLPPFTLSLSHSEAAAQRLFVNIEYNTAQGQFTTMQNNGSICTRYSPAVNCDKVELLTAMRSVEILMAQQPMTCSEGGAILHQIDFQIQETRPPITTVGVAINGKCLAQHEEFLALIAAADEVHNSNRIGETCN
jgi:hypothetical protein